MRGVAMVTLATGVIITALSLTAIPAGAESGFWRSAGLRGVDAFGVYRTRPAKVKLSFFLKDVKKDGAGAAVRSPSPSGTTRTPYASRRSGPGPTAGGRP
jgi:hypothetical protein